MHDNRPIILQSDRLILRDFSDSDYQQILAYQTNPRYLRYYSWKKRSEKDVSNLVHRFIDWSKEKNRIKFQLAIVLKSGNKLIGNCGIRKLTIESSEGELGCELDPDYWGNGFAHEAIDMLLRFGFEDMKLHRIWATTKAENKAAICLVEKFHMQQEGRLREQEWLDDHWSDSLIYAILDYEWKQCRNDQ